MLLLQACFSAMVRFSRMDWKLDWFICTACRSCLALFVECENLGLTTLTQMPLIDYSTGFHVGKQNATKTPEEHFTSGQRALCCRL